MSWRLSTELIVLPSRFIWCVSSRSSRLFEGVRRELEALLLLVISLRPPLLTRLLLELLRPIKVRSEFATSRYMGNYDILSRTKPTDSGALPIELAN